MKLKIARIVWNDWFEEMVSAGITDPQNSPKPFKQYASEKMIIFPSRDRSRRFDFHARRESLHDDTAADKRLRRAIVDLLHVRASESNSIHYWVIDSANMRYRELEEIQRTSRQRARVICQFKDQSLADCVFKERAVILGGPGYCAPILEMNTWTKDVVQAHLHHDPGVTVLYKVADIGKLSGFWTRDANENITYDLTKLVDDWFVSSPNQHCTHNGMTRNRIVFHEHIRTAEAEAAFAWRRTKRANSIVILTLTIKKSDIQQLKASRAGAVIYQKWTVKYWLIYTWWCMARGGVPAYLSRPQRHANATLLIRTMAHAGAEHYKAIPQDFLVHHRPQQFLYTHHGIGRKGRVQRRRYFKKEPREYIFGSDETALNFLRERGTFKAYLVTSTNIKAMAKIEQIQKVHWQLKTLVTDFCDLDMEDFQPMDEDEEEPDIFGDEPYPSVDSDTEKSDLFWEEKEVLPQWSTD